MMDIYLQTGIALILVSGLILLLGLFTKKRQDKANLMNIMGYQSLGPKKGLAMVRVGHEVILVGVTATDVKLLKSVDHTIDETTPGTIRDTRPAPGKTSAPTQSALATMPAGELPAAQPAPQKTSRVIMADIAPAAPAARPAADSPRPMVHIPVGQAAEQTGRIIAAAASANLGKLRALKDYLYAVK